LRDEELRLSSVQPVPAPVCQADAAAVRQIGDEVLPKPVLVDNVAGIGPMHGLACIDGRLDVFECHVTLLK
jgi:hypothetical protein